LESVLGVLECVIVEEVTPNEIAKSLGVTGLEFRNWLRAQKAVGNALLVRHEYRTRYHFTNDEAAQLSAEYVASRSAVNRSSRPGSGRPRVRRRSAVSPGAASADRREVGHRVTETWMGEQVETLADLLRSGLRVVVIGINPSPVSVAVGHYYQGQLGQRFYQRLNEAGVIDLSAGGFEDDVAFAAGIGFTDVVKRPTSRAAGLRAGELHHGRALLESKLTALAVRKVLFTFKASAEALLGRLEGPGVQTGRTVGGAEVFVMPGPMARTEVALQVLDDLQAWWTDR
jgi:TDG/mug DNA glycosylase family protein